MQLQQTAKTSCISYDLCNNLSFESYLELTLLANQPYEPHLIGHLAFDRWICHRISCSRPLKQTDTDTILNGNIYTENVVLFLPLVTFKSNTETLNLVKIRLVQFSSNILVHVRFCFLFHWFLYDKCLLLHHWPFIYSN